MDTKQKKTFWDFCAPFYDMAERRNKQAYAGMLKLVRDAVPQGASVLELAAGTGSVSLAVAGKAAHVLCTDVSAKMLDIARKKARKQGAANLTFGHASIFDTGYSDGVFDVVIAAQVLHLLDAPEKAAAELRRVAADKLILPISLTKGLTGQAKLMVNLFKLLGFSPKKEFDAGDYADFLREIGFAEFELLMASGKIPMVVAVWKKAGG